MISRSHTYSFSYAKLPTWFACFERFHMHSTYDTYSVIAPRDLQTYDAVVVRARLCILIHLSFPLATPWSGSPAGVLPTSKNNIRCNCLPAGYSSCIEPYHTCLRYKPGIFGHLPPQTQRTVGPKRLRYPLVREQRLASHQEWSSDTQTGP